MALLAIGVQGMFDCTAEGRVEQALKRHAQQLSERLGATLHTNVPSESAYPGLPLPG